MIPDGSGFSLCCDFALLRLRYLLLELRFFDFAPTFAILLRQSYEGTSFGGQAGLRLNQDGIRKCGMVLFY